MKSGFAAICFFTTAFLSAAAAAQPAQPRLGINLAGPADWMTELPFVDVFRTSRQWISQRQGAAWGKGPELALDALGWVTRLEPGCYAEAMLCTIQGGHYPAGVYTVLYEGEGKLAVGHNAKITTSAPGRLLVDVDSSKGGFSLQVRETNPQNYVRNIRVVMPGFEKVGFEESLKHMRMNKELAAQFGLKLIAYEGGQHMVAFLRDQEAVKAISKTMHACNRDPRMGALYTRYYDEWARVGGDLFAVFSSIGSYSNHGAWGLAEFYDSKAADYPKLDATLKWARAHGQAVEVGP